MTKIIASFVNRRRFYRRELLMSAINFKQLLITDHVGSGEHT